MPRPRTRRSAWIVLETLESRQLLSNAGAPRRLTPSQAAAARPTAEVAARAKAAEREVTLSRSTTFIRGTVIPARLFGDGKGRGALLVAGKVAWNLELSETKGLPRWGKVLSTRQVVAVGTAEITSNASGKVKRKFKVNWLEPIESAPDPSLYPAPGTVRRLIDVVKKPPGD